MTRFAAYSSDGSTDDEEDKPQTTVFSSKGAEEDEAEAEESDSESSSSSSSDVSEMLEDELTTPYNPQTRKKAFVEDEPEEMRAVYEMGKRTSPGSTSSRSSPGRTQPGYGGDPTVIPWAHHVGVDTQRMHVMQASLFRTREEAANLEALNQPIRPKVPELKVPNSRKHRRDSEGDAAKFDSRERASFAHDIDPPVFRPSRKYARVDISSSVVNGTEGAYLDAGLSMGRSFRVGWGPSGHLIHLGSLCGPNSTSQTSANSSVVTLTRIWPSTLMQHGETSDSAVSKPPDIASKLLQHHLSHTSISKDQSGVPRADPSTPKQPTHSLSTSTTRASSEPLHFASFVSLFPSTDASSCAPVFRLGSALFDPVDLRLGQPRSALITPDVRNRVNVLRRKAALSKWLEDVVKPTVDGDLRIEASGTNVRYTVADAAFSHLTGHQIDEACRKASAGGYFKLATLISQAGGDELFKHDIRSQLDIWKSEKLAPGSNNNLTSAQNGLVGRGIWKIYNLLAGLVDQDAEQVRPEDDICVGLDWKRVFGLYLWYGTGVDASIADVINTYEKAILGKPDITSGERARPIPKWVIEKKKQGALAQPSGSSLLRSYLQTSSTDDLPEDPLYSLIKLHADPTLSLSKALNPLSFSPTGLDLGIAMCWHLYIILSRVMRVRDFADRKQLPRQRTHTRRRSGLVNGVGHRRRDSSGGSTADDVEDDGIGQDGHSPTADLLTSTYAFELESWGMIQEAAFVMLHLEGSVGREKAIKELLARSADKLDDWMVSGLVGSLNLPLAWIDEAKAMYELDCGNVYAAYELYLSAELFNAAHNIAVLELAPDAIIRKDYELLCNLFEPMSTSGRPEKIDGWFVRGQLLLDYARTLIRIPQLLDAVTTDGDEEAYPGASQSEEIDDLTKKIPKIIAVLPEILHRNRTTDARHPAAVEEITKDLLNMTERVKPMLLTRMHKHTLSVLDGASRINFLKGIGYARFLRTVEA